MGFTVVPSPAPLVDEIAILKLDSVKMATCSACSQRSYWKIGDSEHSTQKYNKFKKVFTLEQFSK